MSSAYRSFSGAAVVADDGSPPFVYLASGDGREICFLDLLSQVEMEEMFYRLPPLRGEGLRRQRRKRLLRLTVFGEGSLSAGSVLEVSADGQAARVYALGTGAWSGKRGILILQEFRGLVGTVVSATLKLNGTGLVIRDCVAEFAPVEGMR